MAEGVTPLDRSIANDVLGACSARWQSACGVGYGDGLEEDMRCAFAAWRQAWYDVYNELYGATITARPQRRSTL